MTDRLGRREFRTLRVRRVLAALVVALGCVGAWRRAEAQSGAPVRIVTYNIAELVGSTIDLRKVFQALGEDPAPVTGVIRAPDIYIFQEVDAGTTGLIQSWLDASAPLGVQYRLATFTVNGGGAGENALFYRDDSFVEEPAAHRDITNHTGPRATDRWKLHCAEDASVTLYIYGSHFKAEEGFQFESQRASEADAVRRDADTLPAAAHIIYAGDWNVYAPSEAAFLRFFDAGSGRAVDPRFLGSFAALAHTQSPHDGSNPDLVGGGMDDRFDFQLCSEELSDGAGFEMIAESYRSFGNDGLHYNLSINAGVNHYFRPDEQWKADALALASDHLPVVVDYFTPAPRFLLEVPPLVAGLFATLRASHAQPGESVHFIYSQRGLGQTPVPQLGVTLGLRSPALAGSARADAQGSATLRGRVPVELLGGELWIQAARQGAVTDVVWRPVD